jgi:hypothetical protein
MVANFQRTVEQLFGTTVMTIVTFLKMGAIFQMNCIDHEIIASYSIIQDIMEHVQIFRI